MPYKLRSHPDPEVRKAHYKEYYQREKERLYKYQRERYGPLGPGREKYQLWKRISELRRCYGLELEDVERMYAHQNGDCPICLRHFDYHSKRGGLGVDHNHSNGKVRGLLCQKCNSFLGWFEIVRERAEKYVNNDGVNYAD